MPREFSDNSVHIGRDASGPVTGGSHNRVEVHHAPPTADPDANRRVLDALDAISRLIELHAASIPQAHLATRDVARLVEEVQASEQDPRAAGETVQRLLDRVSAVGSITDAVLYLKDLLAALWPTS